MGRLARYEGVVGVVRLSAKPKALGCEREMERLEGKGERGNTLERELTFV
jgi:hypothetical protein